MAHYFLSMIITDVLLLFANTNFSVWKIKKLVGIYFSNE